MRYTYILLPVILIAVYAQKNAAAGSVIYGNDEKNGYTVVATLTNHTSAANATADDTSLVRLSKKILQAFKAGNYKTVVSYIQPGRGVRFSPYGATDTLHDKVLTAAKILSLAKSGQKIRWGMYDGNGNPISLPLSGYSKKFVYDRDFLKTTQVSVNKSISPGNSFDWLAKDYPGCSYVQFYFPGNDAQYNGMDWKTLILIFREENGKIWLAGVVHDQWRA